MTDDKTQPAADDRTEHVTPGPPAQHAEQGQASAATKPSQRPAPGRKPLFRK